MSRMRVESGFTLTELLISVVIIAIGVVGFATAVGLASTELWIGRRDTEIALLLADQVEQIKADPPALADSIGSRTVGDYQFDWKVGRRSPRKVVLVATYARHDAGQKADTVVTYIP